MTGNRGRGMTKQQDKLKKRNLTYIVVHLFIKGGKTETCWK
jgi:hypothetical protein